MSKTKLIALTTLACGSMVSLSADQAANKGTTNGNGSSAQSYVITPSAQPVVEGDADFFFTADFIWWKPNQEGSNVSTSGFAPDGTTNASKGSVLNPHFQFEPGFKFGVGTTMKHDTWDLYLNWTWFRSENVKSHHATKSTETAFTDLRFSETGFEETHLFAIQDAQTTWNMHFNVIDLELGRNFWISKYLTLRPHFGLKTGWIHQNQKTSFDGVALTGADSLTSTESVQVKTHQHYWGLGIRTGLNTSWHFDRNWSIYGDFALAGLWTDYDNARKDSTQTAPGAVTHVTFKGKNDVHTIEPVLELGLGLMYQTWWHNDDYQFTIAAGWEQQIWFNHNQNINLGASKDGNFTLQGLTVKVGFEF